MYRFFARYFVHARPPRIGEMSKTGSMIPRYLLHGYNEGEEEPMLGVDLSSDWGNPVPGVNEQAG